MVVGLEYPVFRMRCVDSTHNLLAIIFSALPLLPMTFSQTALGKVEKAMNYTYERVILSTLVRIPDRGTLHLSLTPPHERHVVCNVVVHLVWNRADDLL